ncbi:chorismate synthase [Microbacter margulisiae]|uniref:Chorismate synthase n=1 Tax=Microbacter margulisiae TaxID=1350067 RepID=A0A7W5DQL1_9PORP|nr:chorismate synthase [Microbacter margulisiae]MBB3187252.1 chorismate synthase [Microbacter margulisiae]
MSNTFGNIFCLTTFGESHGIAIGGVIDGCPAGITVDTSFVQQELNRRRPGQSAIVTPRQEADEVEFLSGIFEGKTTGTPIGFIIRNSDQHSSDYENLRTTYRPSHADYTYQTKYGIRDYRGGGRSSARETAVRIVGGAIAKLALQSLNVQITAFTSQIGHIRLTEPYQAYDFSLIETNPVRCPDPNAAEQMENLIRDVRKTGDTIGGIITCVARNVPTGWGEPIYNKLHAALGNAMLSINAVKGFDYGNGFEGVSLRGSESNDEFVMREGEVVTMTNHSGGIQGGISNGQDIYFRTVFKPVATLLQNQHTINSLGEETIIKARGRHDPCVLPRAVPIVEAMTAMTLFDFYLLAKASSPM